MQNIAKIKTLLEDNERRGRNLGDLKWNCWKDKYFFEKWCYEEHFQQQDIKKLVCYYWLF